jgi:hypothetical protein
VTRKPTSDGHVTSVELFAKDGTQIAQLYGQRSEGHPEQAQWRQQVDRLTPKGCRMKRWLLLAAFPLLASAAAERIVTSAAMSLRSSMPSARSSSWWRGTAPAPGLPPQPAGRGLYAPAERRGDPRVRPTLVLASAQAQPSLVLKKWKRIR